MENTNPRIDNFLIFDFETGGFDASKNSALEFAGIWIDSYDFREIDRYEALILPFGDYTIEQQALNANGIKIEEIAEHGVDVSVVVANIIEKTNICSKGKMRGKKTVLVGQDVFFDIGFLYQIFKETKEDMSKVFSGKKDFFGNFQPQTIDTLYLGRTKHAQALDKTTFNLTSLCQYDDIDLINAHRAMSDVESTLALFVKYMQSLRSGNTDDTGVYKFREHFKFQL